MIKRKEGETMGKMYEVKKGDVVKAICPGLKSAITIAATKVEFVDNRVILYKEDDIKMILNEHNYTVVAFGPPEKKKEQ